MTLKDAQRRPGRTKTSQVTQKDTPSDTQRRTKTPQDVQVTHKDAPSDAQFFIETPKDVLKTPQRRPKDASVRASLNCTLSRCDCMLRKTLFLNFIT